MRTITQVAKISGISVHALQYYDEINLFKPSFVTNAGYRYYDDESLEKLQQILFFKELDFQLKDIKSIMENPNFDKVSAYKRQYELVQAKRDRLDGLLDLLDKLRQGETCMSFKEFELDEYYKALQQFKEENLVDIVKCWGNVEAFDEMIESFKDKDSEIAKSAVKQYGSVEKYTEAMKSNLNNIANIVDLSKGDTVNIQLEKTKELTKLITSDLNKDIASSNIQEWVKELVEILDESIITIGVDMGENYWDMTIDSYLNNQQTIDINDKIYGRGSSVFLGKALQYYLNNH